MQLLILFLPKGVERQFSNFNLQIFSMSNHISTAIFFTFRTVIVKLIQRYHLSPINLESKNAHMVYLFLPLTVF